MKIKIGLLFALTLVLLSCSKEEWVCTCEQEKIIQKDLKRDFGNGVYHIKNEIINNYYKHKVKEYCIKREPNKDSCDIIMNY